MFKINAPHPISNRTFPTWAHAARAARAFGIPPEHVTETGETPEGDDPPCSVSG